MPLPAVYVLLLIVLVAACHPAAPSLHFDAAELPPARVGSDFAAIIGVSGNTTPFAEVRVVEGALPPGVIATVEQDRGIRLSGRAVQSGDFPVVLEVSCFGTQVAGQRGRHVVRLRVLPAP